MAIIKPFKAVRPANEYVKMVAELPYDVMNREEAKKIAKGNKSSYLHIDRAEIDLDDKINEHDEQVYVKAKENLDKFKKENIFPSEILYSGACHRRTDFCHHDMHMLCHRNRRIFL